jgi:3-hydroxyacyl-[acyl-carrier-protein] dehydratase
MKGEFQISVAPDHPSFAGHFPGLPILPGVVLLDEVIRALAGVLEQPVSADSTSRPAARLKINAAKFFSPVTPGEMLAVCYEASSAGTTRFEISAAHRKVAEGTLASISGI